MLLSFFTSYIRLFIYYFIFFSKSTSSVRFRKEDQNRRKISFYFFTFLIFEKSTRKASRNFAFGEYSLALRLTSKLVDLRAAMRTGSRAPRALYAMHGAHSDEWEESPKKKAPARGAFLFGGATRNRTGDQDFADPCLTAWLWRQI